MIAGPLRTNDCQALALPGMKELARSALPRFAVIRDGAAKLPHNQARRPVRHGRAAFVELSLLHCVELAVQLGELGFPFSVSH